MVTRNRSVMARAHGSVAPATMIAAPDSAAAAAESVAQLRTDAPWTRTAQEAVSIALRKKVKLGAADLAASRVPIAPLEAALSGVVSSSRPVLKAAKREPSVMYSQIRAYRFLAVRKVAMHNAVSVSA